MNYPVEIFWSSSLLLLFQVALFCTILKLSIYWFLVVLFRWLLKPITLSCFNVLGRWLHFYCHRYRNLQVSLTQKRELITVFDDARLWKTKRPRKPFQNFRQSCVLSAYRIEIHQSQSACMT